MKRSGLVIDKPVKTAQNQQPERRKPILPTMQICFKKIKLLKKTKTTKLRRFPPSFLSSHPLPSSSLYKFLKNIIISFIKKKVFSLSNLLASAPIITKKYLSVTRFRNGIVVGWPWCKCVISRSGEGQNGEHKWIDRRWQ